MDLSVLNDVAMVIDAMLTVFGTVSLLAIAVIGILTVFDK